MPKRRKKNSKTRIVILVLLAIFIVSFIIYRMPKPTRIKNDIETIPEINVTELSSREQIDHFISDFGILPRLVRFYNRTDFQEVSLPVNFSAVDLYFTNHRLTRYLTGLNWKQLDGTESSDGNSQILTFIAPDEIQYRFRLSYDRSGAYPAIKPKLSIIIKGFGELPAEELERWLTINDNICLSVIPINRTSKMNMQRIVSNNFEALIEIPMEDVGHPVIATPDYAIFAHFSDKEVIRKLRRYFSLLPGAKGVITHRGGLITTDRRIMPVILKYIKDRNIYFIDDRAIETSIAFALAQQMMLNSFERTITINPDNYINNPRRLTNEIRSIDRNPVLLVFQKPDNETFEMLEVLINIVHENGFELVRVSNLREM